MVATLSHIQPRAFRTAVKNDFGKLMTATRFRRNVMSQEQLGIQCGVSRQTILSIEAGDSCPNLALALLICHRLDIPFDQLSLLGA